MRLASSITIASVAIFSVACTPGSVEESAPSSSFPAEFQLGTTPTFVLGGIEVPPPEQFGFFPGIAALSDGTIWVLEPQTQELRHFDESGAHLRTVGGAGDGPGEFRRPTLIGAGPGDSLFVVDQGVGRLTVFSSSGELGRTGPFFTVFEFPLDGMSVMEDGSVAARLSMPIRVGEMGVGEITPDSGAIVRIRHPRVDTVGWYQSIRSIYTGGRQVSQQIRFTGTDALASTGDAILATSGSDFAVRNVTTGDTAFRVERQARPVDDSLLEAIRAEFAVRYSDPEVGESALATIDEQREQRPTHTPGYDMLLVAPNGQIWARPWAAGNVTRTFGGYPRPDPDLWDVFAPSGEYLGQVETPGRLTVQAVGDGFVVGSRISDLGVVSLERLDVVQR